MSRHVTNFAPSVADFVRTESAKAKTVGRVLAIARLLLRKEFANASEKTRRRWRDILAQRVSQIILDDAARKIRKQTPQ